MIRIVKEIVGGKKKALPKLTFTADLKEGFFMFFKMLPLMVVMCVIWYGAAFILPGGIGVVLASIIFALIFPYLTVNFFVKKTVASSFDIKRAFTVVTKNFMEYLLALIYTIFYSAIYLIACIILIGIPCLAFGRMYYLAEFYGKKK
jgi:hypothetical protein